MPQWAKRRGPSALLAFILLSLGRGGTAEAQVKPHQATGTVAAASSSQVVILKKFGRNTTRWTFLINAKSKLDIKPIKNQRVRIYYHEEKGQRIAERIRLADPSGAKPSAEAQGTKTVAPHAGPAGPVGPTNSVEPGPAPQTPPQTPSSPRT